MAFTLPPLPFEKDALAPHIPADARVVVGGMITSPLAILFVIPVLASYWLPSSSSASSKTEESTT